MARHHRDASRRHVWTAALCLLSSASGRVFVDHTTTTGPSPSSAASVAASSAGAVGGSGVASARPIRGLDDAVAQASEAVQQAVRRMEELAQQLPWAGGSGVAAGGGVKQPEFAGTWRTAKSVNLDDFLDRSMGVGSLKRSIATRASQTQRLKLEQGNVVSLEITDRRGTAKYTIRPDSKWHPGKGFMKLPIKQRAKWGKDGALLVEERYSQHLGGEKHGEKCSGDSCPVVRSRRSVDKASGQMLVEIERTLLDGEVIKTRTYYAPVDSTS